jgi:tetratricopeptide (TPR) repeat protein
MVIQWPFSTLYLEAIANLLSAVQRLAADRTAAPRHCRLGSASSLEDALTKLTLTRRRPASLARHFALALALAGGTALLAVPGFTDAAYAQKKKKKDEAAEAAKPVYSKAFVDAYQPVDAALKAPAPDVATLKPQVLALVPLAVSPDEQQALGGMIFNTGVVAKDQALQLQGAEMMIGSGKLAAGDVGRFNLIAFQIASGLEQYEKARNYLQRAIDLGYTAPNVTMEELQMNVAELYVSEGRHTEALTYLSNQIAERTAAGQPVSERWYKRGVAIAYTNEIEPQVYDFVAGWVVNYPSAESWRDAVNLTRNLNDFDPQAELDLMRLGRKVEALGSKNDYIYYIETADARRLPQEVKDVLEEAYAKGVIPKGSDSFVDEQFKVAAGRIAADRAELPALERDAKAASATYRTVVAAGDAFLNYGEFAKAAQFYEKSVSLPGVDRNLALTRLGIAQIFAGDMAGARGNLAQVDGARAPIAKLWAAYAAQKEASMAKDAMPADAAATTGL